MSSNSIVFLSEIGFVLTGVLSTLGNQQLYAQGAGGGGLSGLTLLATYIGTAMVGLLRRKPIENKLPYNSLLVISGLDFAGNLVGAVGMYYAGSGLYQIVYSSLPIWAALLSFFLLNRQMSIAQWFSVFGVSVGLSLSVFGGSSMMDGNDLSDRALGVAITLLSTLIYSLVYVGGEKVMANQQIDAIACSQWTGTFATTMTLVYMISFVFPQWQTLVDDQVKQSNGNWMIIASLFTLLIGSSFGHSITYFQIIGSVGSVAAGIMQGMRAVLVFGLSSWLFCDQTPSQCYTWYKGISSLIIVSSVVIFSLTAPKKHQIEQPLENDQIALE